MLHLVVYPWRGMGETAEYVAVVTSMPEIFVDKIFSAEIKDFSDKSLDEKARTAAREKGINFVQGLDN